MADSTIKKGVVKQVLSGDAIVLQGPAQHGPPKEITVFLSYVAAPRLAKRPTDNASGSVDEPYAWEAREFLRKKIVGKPVVFIQDFLATSGREHGRVYLGGTSVDNAENITESGVKEGWLEVKPGKQLDDAVQKLIALQEQAKLEKKGRWSDDDQTHHVRDIKWTIDDLRALVNQYKQQELDAVVEQVRDGNSIRAFLLPSFEYVTVMFSGIKAPSPNRDGKSEEYGDEAKFFVESRLLQRDVKIVLESASGQNFVGSVLHPVKGNIAEFLLKDGLAKCVEWSLNTVTGGAQKLREAERYAKSHKLRLWKNYVSNATSSSDRKTFSARVIEIGLGDSLTVAKDNGEEVKIYFSSLRAPRRGENEIGNPTGRQFRPLYDIPFMFQTREFLRKKVIGKKVQVTVDYIQPKSDQFPEKTCCTVQYNGQNLAEALIENGLAKAVRHRGDDENRSPHYDSLLNAEADAEAKKIGLWNTENSDKATIRVTELQGDAARSRQFMPHLQRSTRLDCIVEFVASGSRLRVFLPKENCLITFLIGSINCPRGARIGPGGKLLGENEPFSNEALTFAKSNLLQHDIQIEVESMDKAGGFIGTAFVKNDKGVWRNFAELLVEQGLSTVHFAADKSKYYNQLLQAEDRAKKQRLNLWANYVEEEEDNAKQIANEPTERKLNLKKVLASTVYKGNLHFAAQSFSDGPSIESLMQELQQELKSGSSDYKPKRGEVCACYDEQIKLWHRAKVEGVKADRSDVLYIDFGDRKNVSNSSFAPLPKSLGSKPPLCHEYKVAFIQIPNKSDFAAETDEAFEQILINAPYLELNVEYKVGNIEAVSIFSPSSEDNQKVDVGKSLVEHGLALVELRREPRFKDLINEYQQAEQEARRNRRCIWRWGDFTGQDF